MEAIEGVAEEVQGSGLTGEASMRRWLTRLAFAEKIALLGVIVAALAVVPIFISLLTDGRSSSGQQPPEEAAVRAREIAALRARVAETSMELEQLGRALSNPSDPPSQARLAAQVRSLNDSVTDMRADLSKLEDTILQNPTRALEVPLLRRDLESLKAGNQSSLEAIQNDLDRQYDLMKWVVGTLLIGIIGMVASVLAPVLKGNPKSG
jgi:hypothetical protein